MTQKEFGFGEEVKGAGAAAFRGGESSPPARLAEGVVDSGQEVLADSATYPRPGWQSGYHKSEGLHELWDRRDAIGEALRGTDKTRDEIARELDVSNTTVDNDVAALESQAARKVLAGIGVPDEPVDPDSQLGQQIAERIHSAREPYTIERSRLLGEERRGSDIAARRTARAMRYRLERDPNNTGVWKAWANLCEGRPVIDRKRARPE